MRIFVFVVVLCLAIFQSAQAQEVPDSVAIEMVSMAGEFDRDSALEKESGTILKDKLPESIHLFIDFFGRCQDEWAKLDIEQECYMPRRLYGGQGGPYKILRFDGTQLVLSKEFPEKEGKKKDFLLFKAERNKILTGTAGDIFYGTLTWTSYSEDSSFRFSGNWSAVPGTLEESESF